MGITRRVFLRTGALTGVTAAVPFSAGNAFGQKVVGEPNGSPSDSKNSPFINTEILSFITASVFEGHLNTNFLMHTDAFDAQTLELVQVKIREESQQLDGFSLLFSLPSGEYLPQLSYLFEHEKIGLFPLFIVPVKTPKGTRYEAVFSRLRAAVLNDSK